jgi:integrase/recombinase XerC
VIDSRLDPEDAEQLARHLTWMRRRGLSPRTIDSRQKIITRLALATAHGAVRADAADLDAWRGELDGLLLAAGTIAFYVVHVREWYRWLAHTGVRDENPAEGLPVPRQPKYLPRPIPEDDLALALDHADPDIRLMLVLSGWCGLRAAEIAGLRWESVTLTGSRRIIVGADTAKGRKERVVPLSEWAASEIRRYQARTGSPGRGWVFARRDGNPGQIRPVRVSQMVNCYLAEIGVAGHLHMGRHRFATQALAVSHDLRVVQELLGHSSPSVTAVYTAYDTEYAGSVVDALPQPEAVS